MRMQATLVRLSLLILIVAVPIFLLNHPSIARADDDHGNYRAQATPLEIGSAQITGQIDPTKVLFDVDYFSFQAQRGVLYTFVLDLINVEDANILVVNSASRGARSSPGQELTNGAGLKTVQWIARTTDTYFVEVSGTRDARIGTQLLGTYSIKAMKDLSLQDRHSENRYNASIINVDNVYQGAISPWTNQPGLTGSRQGGDDRDYFAFQASRGVLYAVDVALGTADGVEISIVSPTGAIEVSDDGPETSLEWISPASGTYYIALSGSSRFRDSIGTYSLKLSADTAYLDRYSQDHAGATTLRFGNAHQGAVSPEDDRDVFSFQGTRGVRYQIQAELETMQGIGLSVEGIGGDELDSNGGVGTTLEWIAPTDNLYFVVVSGSTQVRNPVGTYRLTVEPSGGLRDRHGDSRVTATPVTMESIYQASISPEGDTDYFSFQADRGVKYSFALSYGTVAAASLVVDKTEGGLIATTNFGEGTDVEWIAPDDDLYFVVASASPRVGNTTGTYALQVQADTSLKDRHGGSRPEATQVLLGNAMAGALSPPDDIDYFSFDAVQGEDYVVSVKLGTAEAVRLSATHSLSGFAVANYDDETRLEWQAPITGRYVVAVSASEQVVDPVGTYQITIATLDSLPAPTPEPTPTPPPATMLTLPTGPALIAESRIGSPGQTVLVPFSLREANDLTSLGFTLNYDPFVVELVGVIRGARLEPATFTYDSDLPGTVRVGFAATTGSSGGGSVAMMEFRIIGEQGSVSPLTLLEVLASDSDGERLPLNLGDGLLTVGQPLAGDGNGDGKITVLDGLIALRMFRELSPEDLVLDMNGDGVVTPEDARQILTMARPE